MRRETGKENGDAEATAYRNARPERPPGRRLKGARDGSAGFPTLFRASEANQRNRVVRGGGAESWHWERRPTSADSVFR